MAIMTCTTGQMYVLAGKVPTTYRNERLRKQVAAAFGAAEPVLESRALVVDAVAIAIVDDLAARLPRQFAANIVRCYFDKWIEAVAHVEHDDQPCVFIVSELETTWSAAVGPADKLPEFMADQRGIKQAQVVNVAAIMADIRRRAAKAKIDLTVGNFFLPTDHPLFRLWMDEHRRWREAAFAREDALISGRIKPPLKPQEHRTLLIETLHIH